MRDESYKILVVDDEKINIDILVELLSDTYKVIIAKNGLQALNRATSEPPPNIILLDIMMPGMDGYEVCRRLKADTITKEIPVIFITGKVDTTDETRALEIGAVDFIRKPFNPKVVLARIHAHLSLQQQKANLIELNEQKNRFLGMAAHDLRSPLSSIHGLSDLLLNWKLTDEERKSFLLKIHDVSNQMLRLINNLLDVSVIESGRFDLNLAIGNLAKVAQMRTDLMKYSAEKKNIVIHTQFRKTGNSMFDVDRMAQVMDNLLSNAIKFTPPNSAIWVGSGQKSGRLFFQVQDSGPGIPQAEEERLFGVFQKLSTQPTAREKGTGLGLSIVKKIVDAHQGEITVINAENGGSVFTVYLSDPPAMPVVNQPTL